MRDLKHNFLPVNLLKVQDLAYTDTASAWLDTQGFEGAGIEAIVGDLTGVDGSNSLLPTLQESDTTADADATTVAAGDVQGAFTLIDSASEDDVRQFVSYKGIKRYIRVLFNYTGTGISAGYVGATGWLAHARHAPGTAPAAVAAT